MTYFSPRQVILFGSRARGDAAPDSDIDLLVVVDDDTPADKVTVKAGMQARRGYRLPADVIPVRAATFRRMSGIPGTLSREAFLDGITVYGTTSDAITAPDPADVSTAEQGWLRVAISDQRVARACLDLQPPQAGVAVGHCQQAGEKLLKRFLVLAGVDFRKTHEMGSLGAAVLARYPDLTPLVAPMAGWTEWGVAYRYPDGPEAMAEPSAKELGSALDAIRQLADSLDARTGSATA